jgi:hypothetical protein
MQILYAETSLWNELCDQAIDAKTVAEALARQGAQLALGMNVFFEMVKTFGSSAQQARDRAHHLFSYLKTWVRDDFPATRQTPEILADEVWHSLGDAWEVRAFLDGRELRSLIEEIARLADGIFSPSRQEFVNERRATAKRLRQEMIDDLRKKPEVVTRLKQIAPERLEDWMVEEIRSERGASLLMGHLAQVLPKEMFSHLNGIAARLLASDQYKVSHALVRNGVYLNWRIAHRGSVPTSSFDDAYHVVNASYCDKVLTTDSDQAEQVSRSLVGVRVGVYDYGRPLKTWLCAD